MITSKQIITISEDLFKAVKVNNSEVLVYKNPGSSDIVKIYSSAGAIKEFRFIADTSIQPVFVWEAYLSVHRGVIEKLGYTNFKNKPYLAWGFGDIASGKLLVRDWDYDRYDFSPQNIDFMRKIFSYDWKWLDRYIVNWTKFLSERKYEYRKYIKVD